MGGEKTLSIGITVNLENYENLRLEVSGPVKGDADAQELVRFLDALLESFGRGDLATAGRIGSYRKRVLSLVPEPAAECHGEVGQPQATAAGAPEPAAQPPAMVREAPAMPGTTAYGSSLPESCNEPPAGSVAAGRAPAPPAQASGVESPGGDGVAAGAVCEECGAAVKPAEQKMSRLFTSRTLCRACMKKQ